MGNDLYRLSVEKVSKLLSQRYLFNGVNKSSEIGFGCCSNNSLPCRFYIVDFKGLALTAYFMRNFVTWHLHNIHKMLSSYNATE